MRLTPLVAHRRVDEVFERLRSGILAGAYAAGDQLPTERDLAEALGVNRASVREALKRLEFLELVEVRHGHGTFVRKLGASSALQLVDALLKEPGAVTPELLRQLLEFRRHITTRVVELAAQNRSAEHVARAEDLLRREQAEGHLPKAALEIDLAMNALLGEASGNLLYQLVTNMFTKMVRDLGPLYYNEQRDHLRSLEIHRRLLDTMKSRDAVSARRIIETMLDYSEAAILREAEQLEADGRIGSAVSKPAS